MRLAFLADIHGNLPALEAVVSDLVKQGVDAVYLLGDQVNRCPWSSEVVDMMVDRGWPAIYGNHEKVLCIMARQHQPGRFDNRQRFPDLRWTLDHLSRSQLDILCGLPAERRLEFDALPPIRLVHGVPGNPFRGFFLEAQEQQVRTDLASIQEPVIVCAHTHQPLHRTVDVKVILNGGSVGIPYNNDPRAQYLLLDLAGNKWIPTYRRVSYPVERVRQAFHKTGMYAYYGPLAEISLRTVETAQPWTSDFAHWLNRQNGSIQENLEQALEQYEAQHGPGRWSFLEDLML